MTDHLYTTVDVVDGTIGEFLLDEKTFSSLVLVIFS